MQDHEPRQQSKHATAVPLNCRNCTSPCCDWLPNDAPVCPTKLNLDEKPQNNNFCGEANNNRAAKPTQTQGHAGLPENMLQCNSIDKESEEQREMNSSQLASNPDCLLPPHLAKIELKPQRKPCQGFISFEHINPKVGHLNRAHLAANSNKRKDWKRVILQHPPACDQHPQN